MRRQVIKSALFVFALAAALGCGYGIGVADSRQDEIQIETEAYNKAEIKDKKIAVVNLDEGVIQGEQTVEYAAQLLPYAGVDYVLTGLQDARNGVEKGNYSSYIIIPSDFSQIVYSVNTQPAMGKLVYCISDEVEVTERASVVRDILTMGENLNDSLTKIYLSSVLQELHAAQDASTVIMENDVKDEQLLNAVNAGSLIAMVEIPTLTQVANNILPLDLSAQYNAGTALVTELDGAYKSYLEAGQNDLDATTGRAGETAQQLAEASDKMSGANGNLEAAALTNYSDQLKTEGNDVKEELTDVISRYNDYIKTYNSENESTQGSTSELLRQYEEAETYYQRILGPYQTGQSQYELINLSGYIKELARYLTETSVAVPDSAYLDWEQYLEAVTNTGLIKDQYLTYVDMLPDYTLDLSGNGNITGYSGVQDLTEWICAQEEGKEVSAEEAILKNADELIAMAADNQEKLLEEFESTKSSLSASYKDAADSYLAAGGRVGELHEELNGYQLQSYIDEEEVLGMLTSLQANNQEIESKALEYTGEYDQYVSDVYQAASDNITAMQESVTQAEEESRQLLEEGLEEAKASRSENSGRNQELLKEMADLLGYTRIGGVENKEVYEFMASPLSLQQEEETKAAQTSGSENQTAKETQSGQAVPKWMIAVVAVGILVILLAAIAVTKRGRRKPEEF